MLTGMSDKPLVFSTRNMIIAFDAVSFCRVSSSGATCPCSFFASNLSSSISFSPSIAFSPRGVAALSSPSMLALMFMKIWPNTGCPLGISGNRRVKSGLSQRAMVLTRPPISPIFITPIQSDSTPVRPSEISKAVLAESNVESMMAGKTVRSPQNNSLTAATTKATRKNAIQI